MSQFDVKTVYIPAADYIRDYQDVDKFLAYCRACPRYNKCWACPEHNFDPVALVAAYAHVYIIGVKVQVPPEVRGAVKGREAVGAKAEAITKAARKELDPLVLALEKTWGDALCCYGGTCYLCAACQRIEGKPCVYPERRRCSLEALGFDVAATAQQLLGFELLWSEDSLPPYITVISALFTNELMSRGV